jgi:ribosomal protein S18 acetylase RimI-like enzyme
LNRDAGGSNPSAPTDPVIIRQLVPDDVKYVMATWLRDLRDADPSGLPDDLWFDAHRALIERTLADRRVTALVAAAADAPTEILGYIVARGSEVLEWIHVRRRFRNKKLATRLLAAASVPRGTPARWSTPDSRKWLQHPCRSRQIRRQP